MTGEMTQRTAVVTGAAMGIGRACAEALAEEGASVVLVDVDGSGLAVAERLPRALFVRADVSRSSDADRVATEAVEAFGRIDVLVNNAGIQRYGSVLDTPEEVWDEVLSVNLKSVYLMSRACVPHMVEVGGGAVVNVASVQGFQTQRRVAAYAASKAGVINLTRSMAVDLGPDIRVNAVCPGGVDTPMLRYSAELLANDPVQDQTDRGRVHRVGRLARAEEIAQAVVFLAGPRSSFVNGEFLVADGGLTCAL